MVSRSSTPTKRRLYPTPSHWPPSTVLMCVSLPLHVACVGFSISRCLCVCVLGCVCAAQRQVMSIQSAPEGLEGAPTSSCFIVTTDEHFFHFCANGPADEKWWIATFRDSFTVAAEDAEAAAALLAAHGGSGYATATSSDGTDGDPADAGVGQGAGAGAGAGAGVYNADGDDVGDSDDEEESDGEVEFPHPPDVPTKPPEQVSGGCCCTIM